jgi:hypothetical protein
MAVVLTQVVGGRDEVVARIGALSCQSEGEIGGREVEIGAAGREAAAL